MIYATTDEKMEREREIAAERLLTFIFILFILFLLLAPFYLIVINYYFRHLNFFCFSLPVNLFFYYFFLFFLWFSCGWPRKTSQRRARVKQEFEVDFCSLARVKVGLIRCGEVHL